MACRAFDASIEHVWRHQGFPPISKSVWQGRLSLGENVVARSAKGNEIFASITGLSCDHWVSVGRLLAAIILSIESFFSIRSLLLRP